MIALEVNVPVAFESVGETLSDIHPKGDKLNVTIFITKQYNITIEIIQYLRHQNYVMCDCLFFSSLALADTYLATIVDKLELNTFVTVVCCLLHIPATQCKLIANMF